MPGPPVDANMGLTFDCLKRSVSKKTWIDHMSSWNNLCIFCHEFAKQDCSIPDLSLLFVNRLLSKRLSSSYASKILAGVSFFRRWLNLIPIDSLYQVRQVLKGYRRSCFSPDARMPITSSLLKDLISACGQVCSLGFEIQLFRTAFLLAFFGAFRISGCKSSSFLLADIRLYSNSFFITLRKYRTDPYGRGSWIRINQLGDVSVCPYVQVLSYLSLRPAVDGSILVHEGVSG